MNIHALVEFAERHPRLLVLTGAGISAASGIPTYRDHKGRWQRSDPIQHQEFIHQPEKRRRYWARSVVGWRYVNKAQPNTAHNALAELEARGRISLLVTQNVDRLHQRAGHQQVIDLHGRLDRVLCLNCKQVIDRNQLQHQLLHDNPILANVIADIAPDGDAHVEDELTANLHEPTCKTCGGTLMPDVVFFGGNVPKARVDAAMAGLKKADALLVVGSSLMLHSGFRFCKAAIDMGKPIAAINQGTTRADELLQLKLQADCGEVLSKLSAELNFNQASFGRGV